MGLLFPHLALFLLDGGDRVEREPEVVAALVCEGYSAQQVVVQGHQLIPQGGELALTPAHLCQQARGSNDEAAGPSRGEGFRS